MRRQIQQAIAANPAGPHQWASAHPQDGFPVNSWLATQGIQLPPDYNVDYQGTLHYINKNDSRFDKFMTHVAMPAVGVLTGGALLAPMLAGGGVTAGGAGATTAGGIPTTIGIDATTQAALPGFVAAGGTGAIPATVGINAATQAALPGHVAVGASSTAAAAPSAMHSFLSSMATPGGASLVNGGLGLVSGILSANANNKNEAANRQLQKDTTYLNSTQLNPVKQPIDIFRAAALRELASQGPVRLGGAPHDFSGVGNQFLNDDNLKASTDRFYGAQQQFAPPGTPPPPDYFKRRA